MPKAEIAHRTLLRSAIGGEQEKRAGGKQDRDLPGLAEPVGDRVLAKKADDARRNRRDHDEPRDPLVRARDPSTSDGAEERVNEAHDVAPEVRSHGDERAEMEGDVVGLVEAVVFLQERPVGAPGHEDEVCRGGDREELGQPLDDTEHERLAVGERIWIVADAEEREHDRKPERCPCDAVEERAAHGEILGTGLGICDAQRPRRSPERNDRKLQQTGEGRY